jgi:branched-chain amino acid transport system permease protein
MQNFIEAREKKQYLYLFLFAVLVLLFPVFVKSKYFLNVMVFSGIHTIIVVGFCLLMGYAGQVSLGHAAFFGLGAYSSGVLTAKFGMDPWLAFGAGVVITACTAYLVGVPSLKLKGHYLAMATLGFGIIIQIIFVQWRSLTEGTSGLVDIPGLSIGSFKLNTDFRYYFLVWLLTLVGIFFSLNIVLSQVGRALKALNRREIAAEAMGVNTAKFKVQIFVISSVYASVAGSLYTHYVTFLSPEGFNFLFSVLILVMAVFGGLASIWGGVIGAISLTVLPEFLRAYKDYDIIIYGIILILVMMFMPNGILGLVETVLKWFKDRSIGRTVKQ